MPCGENLARKNDPAASEDGAVSISLVNKAFDWAPIIYFYCIYIFVILLGAMVNILTNSIGAVIFLVLLYGKYWQYIFRIKLNFLTYCILLCILLPLVPLISYDEKTLAASLPEIIKYYALHLVLLIGISLPLTPLGQARRNWLLYFVILAFLIIGCFWRLAHGYPDSRMQGFLPNPNGFALTAMMLLMLTNTESPRPFIKGASHIIVIALLLLSRTGGALLGYLAGFVHLNILSHKKKRLTGIIILLVSVSLVFGLFVAMPEKTIKPVDSILDKFEIVEKNIDRVLSGKQIDFYSIIEKKGEDVTSGLWRIFQWHRILTIFVQSSPDKILFGYGIGTTDILFKLKAHNDYLRLLFETGLFGIVFNLAVWIILYRRMGSNYRWIAIMIAIFCITENNYDHFPAMSLLTLYMIGAGGQNTSI